MPSDHRTIAGLRQLLSEAGDLCRHAEDRHAEERLLEEPEKNAIQHLYGQVTADARIAFDFRGSLARRLRNWLRRAEQTVRTAKTNSDIVGNPASADLLNQLRHLVDVANAATLRRSQSHHTWTAFRSAVDGRTGASGPHRGDADIDHARSAGRVAA
jgi:hypothetical protein